MANKEIFKAAFAKIEPEGNGHNTLWQRTRTAYRCRQIRPKRCVGAQ